MLPHPFSKWKSKTADRPSGGASHVRARSRRWRLLLEPLEDRLAPATILWDGGAGSFNWHDPLNWSADTVPGADDDVEIASDFAGITIRSNSNVTIHSLTSAASLQVTDGTFSVAATSSINNSFTLSAGSLVLDGALTNAGAMDWSGGAIRGAGGLMNAGTLTISGTTARSVMGTVLTNGGTIIHAEGGPLFLRDATLNNLAGAVYDFRSDDSQVAASISFDGGANAVNNSGIFRKSGGSGTTSIFAVPFNNLGATIHVGSGTLRPFGGAGGSTGGTFTVANNAVLDLTGGTLTGSYTGSGPGIVRLASGTLTVGASGALFDFPAGLLQVAGGTLALAGPLTNAGAMDWSTASGAGSATTITGGGGLTNTGTLTLSGTLVRNLMNTVLTNRGTIVHAQGGPLFLRDATLNNLAGAVYDFQSDDSPIAASISLGGGVNAVNNSGIFRKSAGSGTTSVFAVPFNNLGATIQVQSGTLSPFHRGGGVNISTGGTFTVADRAVLDLTGGILTGNYTGSGDGIVRLRNGTLNVGSAGATFNFPVGMFQFTDGNLVLDGALTNAAHLFWSGGVVRSGNLTNTGTLTLSTPTGSLAKNLIDGTLQNLGTIIHTGNSPIVLNNGTLSNLAGGLYDFQSDETAVTSGGGTNAVNNAGAVRKSAGSGTTSISNVPFNNSGSVDVQSGTLSLWGGGNWQLDGASRLSVQPGSAIRLANSISGTIIHADQFLPAGTVILAGGSPDVPRLLEVMGTDRGAVANGFRRNFAYGTLRLESAYVRLVDAADNSPGTSAEALYVDTLIVPSGSVLDLNQFTVYARVTEIAGSILGGTVTLVPDGGPIVVNFPTSGTIAPAGEVDDWTFFGRAGQAIAVFANPGDASAPPPANPTLGRVALEIFDPAGNLLGAGSSTAPGETVNLLGVGLPVDGTYRVRVRAADDQPDDQGNYLLSVFNASIDVQPLVLNQQSYESIETPYSVDRWTFRADANQVLRLDVINTFSPAIRFRLTGPNGWTGFSDLNGDSDLLALPSTGAYVLEVSSDGAGAGGYAFKLEQINPTGLTLGTPFQGTLAGSGQGQLFRIDLAPGNPLLIELDDSSNTDRTEVYARLGTPPTRRDFHYRNALPGADHLVTVPFAAPGTWYVWVYGEAVAAPSSFTLRAVTAPVFVRELTPAQHAAEQTATLTIRGAGFMPGAQVHLVAPAGATYTAQSVGVDSFEQLTAVFNLTAVPAGSYDVRVTLPGGANETLPAAFQVLPAAGTANLETRLILPSFMGRHAVATIYVEYANTGTAAMPAPILILQSADPDGSDRPLLTLDQTRLTSGFWSPAVASAGPAPERNLPDGFAHTVQIYASGVTPGMLLPGEIVRVPIYYVGLLQPWDFNDATTEFEIRIHEAGNPEPIDWNGLKPSLRPFWITADQAWDAVFANLTAQIGPTWGDYVRMLSANATYLGRLGLHVTDVNQLYGFELQQALGLNLASTLASAVDAALPTPGLPLEFARSFGNTIPERYRVGPFGRGWTAPWQTSLELEGHMEHIGDGLSPIFVVDAVTVRGPGDSQRRFQSDSRKLGEFFSQPGDSGKLQMARGILAVFPAWFTLTEPSGLVTRFHGSGKVDFMQDVNGNRINAGFTGDRLTSLTHASGALTLAYNAAGLIADITDSVGRVTTFGYDATNDHLLSVTGPAGTTSYTYSTGAGATREHALLSVTEPGGATRLFEYDDRGRLTATGLTGNVQRVEYGYDETGRVMATDAAGVAASLFFDHRGLVARTEDSLGAYTRYEYNDARQMVRETNSLGQARSYVWSNSGQLRSMTDEYGRTTIFTLGGPLNRPTAFTDARGNTVDYAYDAAGNLTSTTYPDGSIERLAYDALGNPTALVNRRGQAVDLTYNAAGQVTLETFPGGSTIAYNYDARSRLSSAVDSHGATTFTYDAADRMTRVEYPNGRWLEYTYDAAGRRTRMEDLSGFVVQYSYDAVGRLRGLRDGADAEIVTYAYDAAGRLSREDKGNDTYSLYTFDGAGRVQSIVHHAPDDSVNSRFDYAYDALGRRTGMTTLDGQWTYTYDLTGQLVRALFASTNPNIPDQDLSYEYDAVGNRVRTVLNGQTTAYTTNALNQYVAAGASTFGYDLDGNLVQEIGVDGTRLYTYDALNRLVRVETPDGTWQYEYDALGNRTATVVNGERTEYLLDLTGLVNVAGEYDGAGNRISSYVHGIGLEGSIGAGGWGYYDFDAIGSTAGLSGGVGTLLNRYAYEPFGDILLANETAANSFQFVGAFGGMNDGNGLEFMRARHYTPALARFFTEDPSGLLGGLNLYGYVRNDPIGNIDPLGLWYVNAQFPLFGIFGGDISLGPCGWSVGLSVGPGGGIFVFDGEPTTGLNSSLSLGASTISQNWGEPANVGWGVGIGASVGFTLGFSWYTGPSNGCSPPLNPKKGPDPTGRKGDEDDVEISRSADPNEKFGAAGFGPQAFIAAGTIIPYRIDFENLGPGSVPAPTQPATAPAQRVEITDQLSADLDWTTLRFTEAGFGDNLISVPAGSTLYFTTVPMTFNDQTFNVEVELSFNSATGRVRAVFQSIDPDTFLSPDVLTGFLPPEDGTGRGKGHIGFSILPRADLPTGTEIRNIALISFDGQTIIATNQVDPQDPSQGTNPNKEALNTIDAAGPSSSVAGLPAISPATFTVTWSGSDLGAGIAGYDVFVSDNRGAFTLWQANRTNTSATFTGAPSHRYAFYSVAIDNVGNRQATPASAQATTRLHPLSTNDSYGVTTGKALSVPAATGVLANDLNSATAVLVKKPVKGTLTLRADGSFTYKPKSIYKGVDSFTYKTRDTVGTESNVATVSLVPNGNFKLASSRGSESVTTVKLTVTLSSPSTSKVTVRYAVTGGSALAAADFKLAAGTLTFSAGQTSKDITLKIINDKVRETSETIQVTLSAPTNAVLGTKKMHTYTVLDNDAAALGHAAMNLLATDIVFAEIGGLNEKRKPNRHRLVP